MTSSSMKKGEDGLRVKASTAEEVIVKEWGGCGRLELVT